MTKTSSSETADLGNTVRRLYELLRDIAINPRRHIEDNKIREALKRQSALAELDHFWIADGVEVSTTPMSLNTLKHYCDLHIDGGFKKFDSLRKDALEALTVAKTRSNTSNKRTFKGINLRVIELEETIDKTRKANFILLQALSQSISAINSIRSASTKQIQDKRADEYIKTVRAIVSLNSAPYDVISDATNVTPITGR
ncbi:hypothetical protein IB256_27735 [Pseudomonas sp. PDM17]|uniref:hypothetical protein n=1 Tax=Pseudomonas sp. PDM17 TaxID=2769285 RepID=UPI00177CCC91|nr:hypothetical protein [Pseudomonas sp. PDM17]MBD9504601.1 hypothetical protein [Pseudomonas sp. PDM17]